MRWRQKANVALLSHCNCLLEFNANTVSNDSDLLIGWCRYTVRRAIMSFEPFVCWFFSNKVTECVIYVVCYDITISYYDYYDFTVREMTSGSGNLTLIHNPGLSIWWKQSLQTSCFLFLFSTSVIKRKYWTAEHCEPPAAPAFIQSLQETPESRVVERAQWRAWRI